jgi:hypothetical protein
LVRIFALTHGAERFEFAAGDHLEGEADLRFEGRHFGGTVFGQACADNG